MDQDNSRYWRQSGVELRAAGFEPGRAARTSAVVTIASAFTNAFGLVLYPGTSSPLHEKHSYPSPSSASERSANVYR